MKILSFTVLATSKHRVRMVVPWVLRNFPWPFADPLQKIKVAGLTEEKEDELLDSFDCLD